jgi:hypothetical protein
LAVTSKVEGRHLNFGGLADMDKADVPVRRSRLDLELAIERDKHEQWLRRRDNATDGMDRELLNDAVDGGRRVAASVCAALP